MNNSDKQYPSLIRFDRVHVVFVLLANHFIQKEFSFSCLDCLRSCTRWWWALVRRTSTEIVPVWTLPFDWSIDWLMDGWIHWWMDCPTDRAATLNRRSIVRRCVVEHRSSSVFWKKRSLDSCNSFTVFALMCLPRVYNTAILNIKKIIKGRLIYVS